MVRFVLAMTLVIGAVFSANTAQANLSSADRQLIEEILNAYARGVMAQDVMNNQSLVGEATPVSRAEAQRTAARARADVTRQVGSYPAAYRERAARMMISWIRENLGTVRETNTSCMDRDTVANNRYRSRNMDPYSSVMHAAVGCLCANTNCDEGGSRIIAEMDTCDYSNAEADPSNCRAYTVQYAQSNGWRFIPVIRDEDAFRMGQGRPYLIRMDWVELENGVVPTNTLNTSPRARF